MLRFQIKIKRLEKSNEIKETMIKSVQTHLRNGASLNPDSLLPEDPFQLKEDSRKCNKEAMKGLSNLSRQDTGIVSQ